MQVRTVPEANQNLSKLIREVEKGEIVIITKNGKRVAEVRPVIEDRTQDPVWLAAFERMMARLRNRPDYGIVLGEIAEEDKYGDAPL